jgi:hypothetical protein
MKITTFYGEKKIAGKITEDENGKTLYQVSFFGLNYRSCFKNPMMAQDESLRSYHF